MFRRHILYLLEQSQCGCWSEAVVVVGVFVFGPTCYRLNTVNHSFKNALGLESFVSSDMIHLRNALPNFYKKIDEWVIEIFYGDTAFS
jgi:hypothetical protein